MVLVVLRLEDNINVPSLQEPLSIDQCSKTSALHELMLQWAFNLKSYAIILFYFFESGRSNRTYIYFYVFYCIVILTHFIRMF